MWPFNRGTKHYDNISAKVILKEEMLEFGKSYVVTLTAAIISADGKSHWAVHGDYKGESSLDGTTYVQFGDSWIKESCIQFIVRADHANLDQIEVVHVTPEGEAFVIKTESNIARAHVVNG